MNENRSENTISEYALDLKVFFRFMMQQRDLVPSDMSFEEIPISDIDLAFVENITRQDIIDYVEYLRMHRVNHAGTAKESTGLSPSEKSLVSAVSLNISAYIRNLSLMTLR